MAKNQPIQILFIALVMASNWHEADGICCTQSIEIYFECAKPLKVDLVVNSSVAEKHLQTTCLDGLCNTFICYDGTIVEALYCGHGRCNPLGCSCEGGCRTNAKGHSRDEAKRLFAKRYGCRILSVVANQSSAKTLLERFLVNVWKKNQSK